MFWACLLGLSYQNVVFFADNCPPEQRARDEAIQRNLHWQGESKPLGQVQVSSLKLHFCSSNVKR